MIIRVPKFIVDGRDTTPAQSLCHQFWKRWREEIEQLYFLAGLLRACTLFGPRRLSDVQKAACDAALGKVEE